MKKEKKPVNQTYKQVWVAMMLTLVLLTGCSTADRTTTTTIETKPSASASVESNVNTGQADQTQVKSTPSKDTKSTPTTKGDSSQSYDVVLHFPDDRYPKTAAHIEAALKAGETPICTIDRKDADAHRKLSLAGIATKDGYDRDEFPMAMCAEGGAGANIQYVESSDNRGSGSWVGNHLSDYSDGTRVLMIIDGGQSGSVTNKSGTTVVRNETQSLASEAPEEAYGGSKPSVSPKSNTDTNVIYANCTAVRDAGKAPIHEGDPGYSRKLDRDGDGVACE